MIGQEKLIKTINELHDVPHSILLIGEPGAEFIDACNLIANKIGAEDTIDMIEKISVDYINMIYASSSKVLYYIDLSKISEKDQNVLLKVYEEPCQSAYFVLFGISSVSVIETIKTRSYELSFDHYSQSDILPLLNDKSNIDLAITPGIAEKLNHTDVPGLRKLCENIVSSMSKASFGNSLRISTYINFGEDYSKYDLDLFFLALVKAIISSGEISLYKPVMHHRRYMPLILDKKAYLDDMIIEMWGMAHGCK